MTLVNFPNELIDQFGVMALKDWYGTVQNELHRLRNTKESDLSEVNRIDYMHDLEVEKALITLLEYTMAPNDFEEYMGVNQKDLDAPLGMITG